MNLTERKLTEMLQENTGTHFLDSGGAYGRSWQRNQGRSFINEAESYLSFKYDYIDVTHNAFHFLMYCLEYDPDMQRRFTRFANKHPDDYWIEVMEKFADSIKGVGIYGEGNAFTTNTYNGECLLSQTLQFTYFETEDGEFVLLQIHGGCDVRGGYTAPKVFRVLNELSIFDYARGTISCTGEESKKKQKEIDNQKVLPNFPSNDIDTDPHYWSTDDGYHWYEDGSTAGHQLETYEFSEDEKDKGKGVIFVDEDGNGYCPICGSLLKSYLY